MEKPRIAVVGGGVFGSNILRAFHYAAQKGVIELAALADLNEDVLKKHHDAYGVKGYTDYKRMFEEERPDGVAVVTPDFLHKQVVLEAAKRHIHVLCQKPLDTSVEGGLEMIRACRDNHVMLCVDFHKRFDPGHMLARQDIRNGRIGDVVYGYACMEDKIEVPSVWFKGWAHNSSPVWFLGVHFYDLICWMIGQKPVSVYAVGVKKKLVSMGIGTYDAIQAQIKFESGAAFTMDASWILPESFTSIVNQNIKIVGTDGIIEVDSENRGMLSAAAGEPVATMNNPYSSMVLQSDMYGEKPQGYVYESMLYFTELMSHLKNGRTLEELEGQYCSGEDALLATKIAQAVHRSVESGRVEMI